MRKTLSGAAIGGITGLGAYAIVYNFWLQKWIIGIMRADDLVVSLAIIASLIIGFSATIGARAGAVEALKEKERRY